ncbi:MAG TPA: Gfo/Idh/MocA family oxidoreductase [Candidatus Limnocylindria bacterium]
MSDTLRTAVIGTGFVGPFHVDAVRRGGIGEVVAIAGSNPERTAARARALGVPRAETDVEALLSDTDIDVIHVCTPNDTHVALARRALEAGKHVVVEKPLALSLADARGLETLAAQVGRHGMVAFTYRGYPMVRRARQLVAEGELGDLRLVHGAYLQDWLAEETDYNWRLEPGSGASRAVADIGSHWIDTVEFVSGRRVTGVFADLATFLPARQRPLVEAAAFQDASGERETVAITSEDAATVLLRLEDGSRGSVVISQVSPGRKNAFGFEMAGSRASLAWEQERPESLWIGSRSEARRLTREPDAATTGVPSLPAGHPEGWAEALRDVVRTFYAAIVDGSPADDGLAPYPTLADGARSVAVVEAIVESNRRQAWVVPASG